MDPDRKVSRPRDGEDRISGIASKPKRQGRDGAPDVDRETLRELGLDTDMVIEGTYRILRPLGAGGMGVVTLALDERLDREVAIKFIRPELFAHQNLRDYFRNEARAMARVLHPNVLVVHAFGEHDGTPYFVMEYVPGRSVEDWLADARRRGERPDRRDALRILEQTCQGVAAIHGAQTVHRDLKPSNLLMTDELHVSVSDLGVAQILVQPDGGEPCCIVGSPAYMAPEAALGEGGRPDLAIRRDIYALGCIAYELLTGAPVFDAPTDMGLMAKHLLEAPARPSTKCEDLPTGYDSVVLRALEKDPHKRWSSVDAFRRALDRVRDSAVEPERILIADDDPDWRLLLASALASRFPDAQIDLVSDGERAIEAFERGPYSVVLVDLEMPELDGMDLTRHLRSLTESAQTPILVLTAAGGPGEWQRLSRIGADAFLVKPVDPDDVAMVIRRTMRSRRDAA
jgi:eukaryotic-like serine/threonine-protein kinase